MAQMPNKNGTIGGSSKIILEKLIIHSEGLTAKKLQELTSIPRRTIYNSTKTLISAGMIKKVGIIFLCHFQSTPPKMAQLLKGSKVQLHNMSFVIQLIKKPEWWHKRQNKLIKLGMKNVRSVQWGNNKYAQTTIDDFLIQCHNQSIIFMATKPYWGSDSYECFEQAVKDFLSCYYYIEDIFKFKFFHNNIPQTSIRSSHFVLLKDALAKKCKKEGHKFKVNIDGKLRMWVDMSDPLGTEAGHRNYAPADMSIYQDYISDVITKEHMKASEVKETILGMVQVQKTTTNNINDMTKDQKHYAENQVTHVGLMKQIASTLKKLDKRIDKMNKIEKHLNK